MPGPPAPSALAAAAGTPGTEAEAVMAADSGEEVAGLASAGMGSLPVLTPSAALVVAGRGMVPPAGIGDEVPDAEGVWPAATLPGPAVPKALVVDKNFDLKT